MKKILKLFSNCILVKGAKRQIICDLQKDNIYFIPEALCEILTLHSNTEIEDIKDYYKNQYDEAINKYVSYLLENELAFFCSSPESFPEIEIKWEFPGYISNAIIEIDKNSKHNFIDIFFQLEKLGCKFLEIRFYDTVSIEELIRIVNFTDESKFRNIELLIAFDYGLNLDKIEELFNSHQRIGKLIIHCTPEEYDIDSPNSNIVFTKQNIRNNHSCGQVSINYFTANIEMFMESKLYNSCLNRKISIDSNGEIRNCPSLSKSFGNIKNTTLKQAIEKQGFKDYWFINKDQIEVCKDCEFRYICTDCRAFIEEPNNIYSKPLKCGYNPYTSEWEEWSTNPLKQKAINYYKINDEDHKEFSQ